MDRINNIMFERAWHVGTFANIPVKIHWTFLLILIYVGFTSASQGADWMSILIEICFVLAMFFCVVLHEFGHALTAKRYGIRTEDIILLPIGGVARLRNMPEKPIQELIIAVMGPMVNVGIAILVFIYLITSFGGSFFSIENFQELNFASWAGFLPLLMISNIMLVVFNMIPAFPMDGGRVLRALLAMGFGKLKATRIASIVGQIICVLLILAGIYYEAYTLAIIGVFIFINATQEYKSVALDSAIKNKTIKDCYRKEYHSFTEYTTVQEAYEFLMHCRERYFVVINLLGQFCGSVSAKQIQIAYKKNPQTRLTEIYNRQLLSLDSSTAILNVLYSLRGPSELVLVTEEEEVIGVVDLDSIQQYIDLNS
ncbi:MAG: site-2 protease family protein [Saprospiraceae bacterium]